MNHNKVTIKKWFKYIFKFIVGIKDLYLSSRNTKYIVFCDAQGPTYQISFLRPFKNLNLHEGKDFLAISNEMLEGYLKSIPLWILERLIYNKNLEAVIYSRFSHPMTTRLMNFFTSKKVPNINHMDDLLIDIPENLGREIYERLNNKEKIEIFKYLIQNCDLNYISTDFLKNFLSKRFSQANYYSGIYASYQPFEKIKPNPDHLLHPLKIGYMASKGHVRDFELIIPAIEQILKKNSQVTLDFFGTISPPDILLNNFPNRVFHIKGVPNYSNFLDKLNSLNWDIGLIPLIDDEWNKCKAPTKYIEYTSAHIPVISSDILVYNHFTENNKNILLAKPTEWESQIQKLIDNPDLRKEILINAQSLCNKLFSLDTLTQQVMTVFSQAKK